MAWGSAQPLAGSIGGLMIGLSAAIMLLGLGRIAGVSGLAARTAGIAPSGAPWIIAAAFIVGLPLGAGIVAAGGLASAIHMPASISTLIAAGLFVGIGTRLGSGCTSGHGVCGLSRLSLRSMLATITFMGAGIATVAAMRGLEG